MPRKSTKKVTKAEEVIGPKVEETQTEARER